MKAIYAGSFDPITKGHLDIIERASKMFDELYLVVAENIDKKCSIDSVYRIALVAESVSHLKNVKSFNCNILLAEFAKAHEVKCLIRGLRTNTDFEQELIMAQINRELNPDLETIFIPTDHNKSFISSSMIRQLVNFGYDISRFVPNPVINYFKEEYSKK